MILTNSQLADRYIESNCEDIYMTNSHLTSVGVYFVPIGSVGRGISTQDRTNIVDTMEQISEEDADAVNDLINVSIDSKIISENGYPGD